MSMEFFIKTWTVTQPGGDVKKGQSIRIIQNPRGGANDLAFAPVLKANGMPKQFGDNLWETVSDLHWVKASDTVVGTAILPDRTKPKATIRNGITISKTSDHKIRCKVGRLGSLGDVPHTRAEPVAQLRPGLAEVGFEGEAGAAVEEPGEWEAEDEGGG